MHKIPIELTQLVLRELVGILRNANWGSQLPLATVDPTILIDDFSRPTAWQRWLRSHRRQTVEL